MANCRSLPLGLSLLTCAIALHAEITVKKLNPTTVEVYQVQISTRHTPSA